MDSGKSASGQKTLSPQPYPTPRSHLSSGMQVREFKHNSRTCPNWTLDPRQGRGLLTSHGRVCERQWAQMPTNSGISCSSDGRSLLPSEPEIWPRHHPLGVWGCRCAVGAHPDFGSKKSKIYPSAGPYQGRGKASNLLPFEYELPRCPPYLCSSGFPGILAPRGHRVGSRCQNW